MALFECNEFVWLLWMVSRFVKWHEFPMLKYLVFVCYKSIKQNKMHQNKTLTNGNSSFAQRFVEKIVRFEFFKSNNEPGYTFTGHESLCMDKKLWWTKGSFAAGKTNSRPKIESKSIKTYCPPHPTPPPPKSARTCFCLNAKLMDDTTKRQGTHCMVRRRGWRPPVIDPGPGTQCTVEVPISNPSSPTIPRWLNRRRWARRLAVWVSTIMP